MGSEDHGLQRTRGMLTAVSRHRLAVATGNQLGAQAAARIAREGGNAVDACLGAAVMAWVAEPFFASLGGAAYVVIRTPEGHVEVIDGNNSMPGTLPATPGQGAERVYFPDYADGMYTQIGGGSVAVPGALAAVRTAWERHGRIEWEALLVPAIQAATEGIAFPKTSAYYLSVTWDTVWSKYAETRALFSENGEIKRTGDPLVQSALAESLEMIADKGAAAFYGGELGTVIADAIAADGGFLAAGDLEAYQALVRRPVSTRAFGWRVDTNPPPAAGGAVLTHMLSLLESHSPPLEQMARDSVERLRAIVSAQRISMDFRRSRYQDPGEIAGALEEILGKFRDFPNAPSTTHSSCADAEGNVCSLTESNGYGAGLTAAGILLNNTLGEEELNPLGVHGLSPGMRCHSNMAPTIASGPSKVVALGSPGADRIVSATAQAFLRLAVDGDTLAEALAGPRAHLDFRSEGEVLCYEPGLPGDRLGATPRAYPEPHMYFGGVNAALVSSTGEVDAAHDPRRSGAEIIV